MPKSDDITPLLAPNVVVRQIDDEGRHVVKHPGKSKYLKLGVEESFLLGCLDGGTSYQSVIDGFRSRFGDSLSVDDVHDFVRMIDEEGLLAGSGDSTVEAAPGHATGLSDIVRRTIDAAKKQSPMFFRVALFNPNATLNWLEPRTRWLFSRELAVVAAVGCVMALLVTWANRDDIVTQFNTMFGWRTLALAWITTIVVTICHEFGHGLACKRYGGEVHEMGALWIFFTPCLFCNVSDAWLLSSRWRRLLISMAGTYIDLLIWIVSVFLWRVTAPDTALNYMAWIVVTTCGLRVAFNLNPLMRMDGYYAMSDLLGIPNLRKRSRARWMEYVRWMLWGAARPESVPEGRALLIYGVTSWFFAVGFLNLLFFQLNDFLKSTLGLAGFIGAAALFIGLSKRYFKGSLGEEFHTMIQQRKKRLLIWALLVVGLLVLPIHDRVGGPFHVRPAVRWEVRAPIDGFLREVMVDQGASVEEGAVLARLEVPGLSSELTRKAAEIDEVRALLRRLEAGPRREELIEQREKVRRAKSWRDLAQADLQRARRSLDEELASLDLRIAKADSELNYRRTSYQQSHELYRLGGLAGQQLLAERKHLQISEAELRQAQAAKRAREAEGNMRYEAELARREKDLADTQADLKLLEAGSRAEDIDAQRARLARLIEEQKHLVAQEAKQVIIAPAAGTVTTPRLREKIGQFLGKGAELCFVEDQAQLEAEVAIAEQDARVLKPGQQVTLKPRSLPFHKLVATVDRIAPSAAGKVTDATVQAQAPSGQPNVTVYCQVDNDTGELRTGMTGYGRVYHRWRPLGWIGLIRTMQFFRTEFWL